MSTIQSWISELDLAIANNGRATALAQSSSSSDRAVLTLHLALHERLVELGSEAAVPSNYMDWTPVELPRWVPRPALPQQFRLASSASSLRQAEVLRKRAQVAAAKLALAQAELEEAEFDDMI